MCLKDDMGGNPRASTYSFHCSGNPFAISMAIPYQFDVNRSILHPRLNRKKCGYAAGSPQARDHFGFHEGEDEAEFRGIPRCCQDLGGELHCLTKVGPHPDFYDHVF